MAGKYMFNHYRHNDTLKRTDMYVFALATLSASRDGKSVTFNVWALDFKSQAWVNNLSRLLASMSAL